MDRNLNDLNFVKSGALNSNADILSQKKTKSSQNKEINAAKNAEQNSASESSENTKLEKNSSKKRKKEEKVFKPSDLEDLKEKLDKKESSFFRSLSTKRFAKQTSRGIIVKKLTIVSLISIMLIVVILYILSYTYVNSGYGVNIIADRANSKAISLSDNSSFQRLSVGLKATAVDSMDNITYDWLENTIDTLDGSQNGENYICYTFYVLNTGNQDLSYKSMLTISNATQNVETAIRVQIFTNGIPTVYTHTYEEQIDGIIENDRGVPVETFFAPGIISSTTMDLEVGDFNKYTVVIWLEGEDIDCVNDKFSSELQLIWRFSVIDAEDDII